MANSNKREYGRALMNKQKDSPLLKDVTERSQVWMSHADRVEAIPAALEAIAHSGNSPYAAVRTRDGSLRGIQFHPEVAHTPCGVQVLGNFVHKICGEAGDWTPAAFVETKLSEIRARIGSDGRVRRRSGP